MSGSSEKFDAEFPRWGLNDLAVWLGATEACVENGSGFSNSEVLVARANIKRHGGFAALSIDEDYFEGMIKKGLLQRVDGRFQFARQSFVDGVDPEPAIQHVRTHIFQAGGYENAGIKEAVFRHGAESLTQNTGALPKDPAERGRLWDKAFADISLK